MLIVLYTSVHCSHAKQTQTSLSNCYEVKYLRTLFFFLLLHTSPCSLIQLKDKLRETAFNPELLYNMKSEFQLFLSSHFSVKLSHVNVSSAFSLTPQDRKMLGHHGIC